MTAGRAGRRRATSRPAPGPTARTSPSRVRGKPLRIEHVEALLQLDLGAEQRHQPAGLQILFRQIVVRQADAVALHGRFEHEVGVAEIGPRLERKAEDAGGLAPLHPGQAVGRLQKRELLEIVRLRRSAERLHEARAADREDHIAGQRPHVDAGPIAGAPTYGDIHVLTVEIDRLVRGQQRQPDIGVLFDQPLQARQQPREVNAGGPLTVMTVGSAGSDSR